MQPTDNLTANRMDGQYVDIYIDSLSRPQAYTYLRGGSLVEAKVHWPIAFCNDCLAVLAVLEPFPFRHAHQSSGAVTLGDVIGRKWAKEWPRDGKPQTKRPATRDRVAQDRIAVEVEGGSKVIPE